MQILRMNARKVLIYCQTLNTKVAKQCCDDGIPLPKAPIKQMMKNLELDIRTLNDLAEWWGMPKGELQNNIAWCLNRYADFTDYVNHNQYSSHLNNGKYIL